MVFGFFWLDIVYSVIFIFFVFRGSQRGVGNQMISIIWLVPLIVLPLGYYRHISDKLFGFLDKDWSRPLSFLLICAALFLALKLIPTPGKTSVAEEFSFIERSCGALAGAIKALVILGLIGIQLLLLPFHELHDSVSKEAKAPMYLVKMDANIYSWMTYHTDFMKNEKGSKIVEDIS
ncbi:MAG: CvpA family protein [Candidatus Omnitrophica bacterium]|nr:CvpA family protein [Candidatus Omnitrophota bacterium]